MFITAVSVSYWHCISMGPSPFPVSYLRCGNTGSPQGIDVHSPSLSTVQFLSVVGAPSRMNVCCSQMGSHLPLTLPPRRSQRRKGYRTRNPSWSGERGKVTVDRGYRPLPRSRGGMTGLDPDHMWPVSSCHFGPIDQRPQVTSNSDCGAIGTFTVFTGSRWLLCGSPDARVIVMEMLHWV